VRFLLVSKDVSQERVPRTFYIMENKVWNALYARFANEQPNEAGVTWVNGGWRGGEEESVRALASLGSSSFGLTVLNQSQGGCLLSAASVVLPEIVDPIALGNGNPRHPALRMSCKEAMAFAAWLGGRLPSVEQWDRASGYDHDPRGRGPFREPVQRIVALLAWTNMEHPANLWFAERRARALIEARADPSFEWDEGEWEIAINRREYGPLPVGDAFNDISPFGCHDMAGNGLEWTRTPSARLGSNGPTEDDAFFLRGSRYSATQPWLFSEMEQYGKQQWKYLGSNPQYGFRVVIEIE
jgi:formylglycine-generating enzyme required for sulfatase activity